MSAELIISGSALLLSLGAVTLSAASFLLARKDRGLPVRPFARPAPSKDEPEYDLVAGLEEWPEWTVSLERIPLPQEPEVSGDPQFKVTASEFK